LHDIVTIVLNGILLVIVLFYAYPLKFMFSSWMLPSHYSIEPGDFLHLIYVYLGGYIAVYLLFVLMYCNAYAKREELQLTAIEQFETRTFMYSNVGLALAGVIVILAAIVLNYINVGLTFGCFVFFGVAGPVVGGINAKRAKLFHKKFGNLPMTEPHHGADR
jgi:hypothetical protein